jgi:hypothetical protein
MYTHSHERSFPHVNTHTHTHTHIHTHPRARTHTHTGPLNDVYRFSAAANTWTALSPSGSGPSPRYGMGFAATPDGMVYVFGGAGIGNVGEEGAAYTLLMCMYMLCIYTQ